MNKKIALVFVIALICFAFPVLSFDATGNLTDSGSFVPTQDITNVEILSSQVVVADGSTNEELPSNLGGLISSFQEHFIYILKSGDTIFHTETLAQDIEAFSLVAFPTNSSPDFNTLIEIGIFTESEPLVLEGRTTTEHIWITYDVNANSGEDIVPGFFVNSFEQQVFMLAPPGVYDIFIIA